MTDFLDTWGISLMVFLPLVGVAVMMLIPERDEQTHKLIALAATVASAVVGILLLIDFNYDDTRTLQFVVDKSWIDVINARYMVALDGISLPLVALTLLVTPLVVIYSWNHIPEPGNAKAFLILTLVLHTGMLGTLAA